MRIDRHKKRLSGAPFDSAEHPLTLHDATSVVFPAAELCLVDFSALLLNRWPMQTSLIKEYQLTTVCNDKSYSLIRKSCRGGFIRMKVAHMLKITHGPRQVSPINVPALAEPLHEHFTFLIWHTCSTTFRTETPASPCLEAPRLHRRCKLPMGLLHHGVIANLLIVPPPNRHTPVSYTHLDVYKRQLLDRTS